MMKRLIIVAVLVLSFAEAHAAIVPATSFIDTETGAVYISTGIGGPLVAATLVGSTGAVTIGNLPSSPATSTKQSDGSQKTQIVDGSGNVASMTSNAQDVNLKTSGITLPVSGPLTDAQLRATPAPVSGTVTANAGTNLNTSALALEAGGNLAAVKTDVDKIPAQGQALAAASMPVVLTAAQIATLTPPAAIAGFALDSTVAKDASLSTIDTDLKANIVLKAGTNVIGHVIVDAGTAEIGNVKNSGTFPTQATLAAETTKVIGTVNIAAGQTTAVTNAGTFPVQATAPTLTKATQGANGYSTQDLKDAGRTSIVFTATFTVVSGSSVAVTQQSKAGVVTSSTSYTVTAGKTLRLQCFSAGWRATSATTGGATCRIKWATSGSPTGSSANLDVGSLAPPPGTLAANQGYANFAHSFPDGIEVTSGQIAIEIQGTAAQGTVDVALVGYEY